MPLSTKAIKTRIQSVKNTRKITKAMEMVAASKMRRAVERSLASRQYAELALELLVNISKEETLDHPLLRSDEGGKDLLIIIASNKGLCGAYNVNVWKQFSSFVKERGKDAVGVVTVGRYAERFAKKAGVPVVGSFIEIPDTFGIDAVRGISRLVMDEFQEGRWGRVHVLYTRFLSSLSQTAQIQGILPITAEHVTHMIEATGSEKDSAKVTVENLALYLFEPSEEEVLEHVLPTLVETQIYQALLESSASEHSARMIAMKNASDNAEDMIGELTLSFNKARQAAITQEIVEIATGAQAL